MRQHREKRKRPIAARTRRAAAALSTVQPVASEATPALSLRFTRERRPEPVPMCVSCGGGLERGRTLGTIETAVSKWPLGQGGRVSLILREGRRGVPNSRERVPFFPRFCRTRRRGPGWESSAPSLGARRVCVRRPSPASPRPRSLTRLRVQFGTAARWAAWSSRVLGLAPDASAALALCTCRDGRPSFFHRRADAPRSR